MKEFNFFKIDEFTCKCGCGENKINKSFIAKLDESRGLAAVPFKIVSGYRCKKHNDSVKGVEDSAHVMGVAADIECSESSLRFNIIKSLMKPGFSRIGIAKNFIHVDAADSILVPGFEPKPANVIWTYN